MKREPVTNILLVGVGGQGIILASEILAEVALRSGLDAKKSEVHGMSQRGGVVSSHVRFGDRVHSPLVEEGAADVLCSFEILESLRWLPFVGPAGNVFSNTQKIVPPIAASGMAKYPDDPGAELLRLAPSATLVPAWEIARELGNEKLVNSVMMGKLSSMLALDVRHWLDAVAEFVPPKARDVNVEAFNRGRAL